MVKFAPACLALLSLARSSAGARFARKSRGAASKSDCYSKYDGHHLLSMSPCEESLAQQMQEAVDAAECVELSENGFALAVDGGCAKASVVCPASATVHLLQLFGESVEVENKNAGVYMRATAGVPVVADARALSDRDSFYSSYRLLDDQNARVDAAVQNSGGACVLEEIGRSIENRPLRSVRVRGSNFRAGGPRVVLTFGIHAREWVAHMAGVYAVEEICKRASSDSDWLSDSEVMLVPMGNPDGHVISTSSDAYWRKNRNPKGGRCMGVDLNRNWPNGWGGRYASSWACSQSYYGTGPLSEPESQAIAKVIDESPNSVLLDVHCFGRMILKPFGYTNDPHPRISEVDALGQRMLSAIKRHRNNSFVYGGNELLGPASGTLQDYANGGLGYTYELTTSFFPSASDILPSAIESLEGMYEAIAWAKGQ